MTETGRIVAWDRQKGYGYVEADGRRVFLHVRDFADRHKAPEPGDVIVFSLGTDRKGRPCAVKAVHQNDGGRIRPVHLASLGALLIAPAVAGARLAEGKQFWYLVGVCIAVSAVTYFVYADDKERAQQNAWRAPENILHFFEAIGGWPGAFLAQRRLRHKCSKLSFQMAFWLIVAGHQFAAIDYLLGWKMAHATREKVGHWFNDQG